MRENGGDSVRAGARNIFIPGRLTNPYNRMIKKNYSERRFHTAGARIMASSRLPSDFFYPSREQQVREKSQRTQLQEDM